MTKIEKNIQRAKRKQKPCKYPWNDMDIGDAVEAASGVLAAYTAALAASKRYSPKAFKGGRSSDGRAMIWRIS